MTIAAAPTAPATLFQRCVINRPFPPLPDTDERPAQDRTNNHHLVKSSRPASGWIQASSSGSRSPASTTKAGTAAPHISHGRSVISRTIRARSTVDEPAVERHFRGGASAAARSCCGRHAPESSAHGYPASFVSVGSHGRGMARRGFPGSILEFQKPVPDDDACRAYLFASGWPDGFSCPRCASGEVRVESTGVTCGNASTAATEKEAHLGPLSSGESGI